MTDADLCRQNGWTVGARLVGDDGFGPTTIEITAIGESHILAKQVLPEQRAEEPWRLEYRDWTGAAQ